MERARFNAHHFNTLGKIYHLSGYTGPVGFGTHTIDTPVLVPEDPQDPALPLATGATPSHEEDLDEDLDEEQTGEDEEVKVLSLVFSVLNMSFDVPRSQE